MNAPKSQPRVLKQNEVLMEIDIPEELCQRILSRGLDPTVEARNMALRLGFQGRAIRASKTFDAIPAENIRGGVVLEAAV